MYNEPKPESASSRSAYPRHTLMRLFLAAAQMARIWGLLVERAFWVYFVVRGVSRGRLLYCLFPSTLITLVDLQLRIKE